MLITKERSRQAMVVLSNAIGSLEGKNSVLETMDVIRHMARGDLRLVWYHGIRSGKKTPDLVELQTTSARELNTASLGFVGPAPVSPEVLNELVQLKFVERVAASDASKSVFHLSDAGRARALEPRG